MNSNPTSYTTHEYWMIRAIELARRGCGAVEPNPMVGCIVVKDGVLLRSGFHERFGGPHAEVNALAGLATEQIRGAVVYVTLEPCSHFGKTPPCVELLIAARPKLVVVGMVDPFPKVAGQGIQKLREAGIEVIVDVNREACRRLVAPYLKRLETGLPWIIAKWAMTLDGRLATHANSSKWVTSEVARQHSHRVRSCVDGIMIGIGTVLADNPMLNVRKKNSEGESLVKGTLKDTDAGAPRLPIDSEEMEHRGLYSTFGERRPIRIVMDRMARTPLDSQLVQTASEYRTIIACGPLSDRSRTMRLREKGCEVIECSGEEVSTMLSEVAAPLVKSGMTNLLVDGGPRLIGELIDRSLVDEVHVYIAPKIVGGPPKVVPNHGEGIVAMDLANRVEYGVWEKLGDDLFFSGLCRYA